MNLDPKYFGPEAVVDEDRSYPGSRFPEVWKALVSTAYYTTWGTPGEPLPVYEVTLRSALAGLLSFYRRWQFQDAAKRTVDSRADLRWGPDGRGFRRILHPNGICLAGTWEIDPSPPGKAYSGYFGKGSRGLVVARYSTCCSEPRRGHYRSLSLVGQLYPTLDRNHPQPLRTARFITQEDIGGARTDYINDAELRNAPDTTPWRRGAGLPVLLVTGLVLSRADKQISIRQLYEIAELGKAERVPTAAPEFMRLVVDAAQPRIAGPDLDFREEILAQIYDRGDPRPKRRLVFHIEVSDEGETRGLLAQRRTIHDWERIGRLVFDEAVASYNGDFVIHFHHPPWRNDRNDPSSLARRPRL
jgi:hypothetical protein